MSVLEGCNVGRGCLGSLLLHGVATNMSKKNISISAPLSYSGTILPGIIPHFSYNGRDRKLDYDKQTSDFSWSTTTFFNFKVGDSPTMVETCHKEITKAIKKIHSERKRRKCKPMNSVSAHNLSTIQAEANALLEIEDSDVNSQTRYDIFSMIDKLRRDKDAFFNDCQRERFSSRKKHRDRIKRRRGRR